MPPILVIAIDLGTSATTASYVLARDSYDAEGVLHRKYTAKIHVRDWPGAGSGDPIGKYCLPTELVFDRVSRRLLFWGFGAEQYLDDPCPEIPTEQVFVVKHIKLALPIPDETKVSRETAARYRAIRERLKMDLQKDPFEVFQDYMDQVLGHIIWSARDKYDSLIDNSQIELILAFPSGWDDSVHSKVARISAKAMEKAISARGLQNMVFGIQNVYTASETLCGVKEWLRDIIAEASISTDQEQTMNLDELNEGDCFLPIDIGGGTGCMTPLRLVGKNPLRVDQLGPTQSLEVSGEAVEAEFEKLILPQITKRDYPGDIPKLVHYICRKFKDEKRKCGEIPKSGSSTWNVSVPRLRANSAKGFERDCMKINRKFLNMSFDPAMKTLESGIQRILVQLPEIKLIVFLGQFGGSSKYLRLKMENSPFRNLVKFRYSHKGKLDVVKGAMSERLRLTETFVRKYETSKSYGTLVTLPYHNNSDAKRIFPNPLKHGAVPFEQDFGIRWLTVIEWAIPKGTMLENGIAREVGRDKDRHHSWPLNEKKIRFEDVIIVSDETPPPPQLNGKSFTLWTKAHEENRLTANNQRMQVQQIPFAWDLAMSQKLDANGNILGQFEPSDLEQFTFWERKRESNKKRKRRRLHYELIWHITEMQVKVHVKALFPNPAGPLVWQLAAERDIGEDNKTMRESMSKALKRDIEISSCAPAHINVVDLSDESDNDMQYDFADIYGPSGVQLVTELVNTRQNRAVEEESPPTGSPTGWSSLPSPGAPINNSIPQRALLLPSPPSSEAFSLNDSSAVQYSRRRNNACLMTRRTGPVQQQTTTKEQQQDGQRLTSARKRKFTDDSGPSEEDIATLARGRSWTKSVSLFSDESAPETKASSRSNESGAISRHPAVRVAERNKYTARRGGKSGSGQSRW